jgi:hypothetical protein
MTITWLQFAQTLWDSIWWVEIFALVLIFFSGTIIDWIGVFIDYGKDYYKEWRRQKKVTHIDVVQEPSMDGFLTVHQN